MSFYLYFILAAVLFGLELFYFAIAERYRIVDKPNERSSHKHPTIRGGGIIFIFALILFSILHGGALPFLMIALLLSGGVSFIDDIRSLPNRTRFFAHLISALLLLYQAGMFALPLGWIVVVTVLIIGVINAYNFMDGINGITGFYSFAIILPLYLSESDDLLKELQLYIMIGLLVFLFFNARKRARSFAGDVGSVSMAVIVLFLLLSRIYRESNINYAGFLLLYGADTVLTIIQRLYLRENIFKAHRRHLFQLYCNEFKKPHLLVSAAYGLIQLGINFLILRQSGNAWTLPTLVLVGGSVYIVLKWMAYRRINNLPASK